jgi:multiple sugar transport system permease protein
VIQPEIQGQTTEGGMTTLRKKGRFFRQRDWKWNDVLWGYAMIAPLMLGLLVFYIWPAIQTFFFSFTEWGPFGDFKWTGLTNYQNLLNDPDLIKSFENTFFFTVLSVPIGTAIALVVAVLLNQKIRGRGIYRTLYFLPVVTMPAAIAMMWKWLFNGDYGVINAILKVFLIDGTNWLTNKNTALFALVVVAIWSSIGYKMIILLSGLQSIPGIYYEAASLDGATPVSKLIHITLPLLTPALFFVTVVSFINAFQTFDLVYLMIGQNSPVISETQTVTFLFFKYAFIDNNKGYAATVVFILFLLILVLTIIQLKLQKRWVHYE